MPFLLISKNPSMIGLLHICEDSIAKTAARALLAASVSYDQFFMINLLCLVSLYSVQQRAMLSFHFSGQSYRIFIGCQATVNFQANKPAIFDFALPPRAFMMKATFFQ